jgi:hypothetical protein
MAALPIRLLAQAGAGVSGALLPTRYQFDPADYPVTVWDDDFTTDRLAQYRVDHPAAEPSPQLTVADGVLTAAAGSRAFAVLAAPTASGTAVIVEPSKFAGSAPEDSLFLGWSPGALAWYNNHFGTSGADVPGSGCCAGVRWQPGDRFAALSRSGTLTTWHEHAGAWVQIHSAPLASATGSPAFGLRLDNGTMGVSRFTVLGR